ncbi:MAG TPA: hypothetical protein DEG47_01530, partial [Cyanobacteria bacterium UBA11148]|nr:hypothetical protein [Cyanobacteria bacterium UBA11148]
MIGKLVKGNNFAKCLNYVLNKEGAKLIGGNMAGENSSELSGEFRIWHSLNHRVTKPVCHISLSLPTSEHLDDRTWCEIAQRYLTAMGFTRNQYIVARHTDTAHDHVHIVASRVRLDGTCVKDSWDYQRTQQVLSGLEASYNLTPTISDTERRAPTTGQMRRYRKEQLDYESGKRSQPAQLPAIRQLQQIIDENTSNCPTLTQLVLRLQQSGVTVRPAITANNQVVGISFGLDSVYFPGNKLGKAYSLPGLQKYRGVEWDCTTQSLIPNSKPLVDQNNPVQQQFTQIVAPIAAKMLCLLSTTKHRGDIYTVYWQKQEETRVLVLERNADGVQLMKAKDSSKLELETGQWIQVEKSRLTTADVEQFMLISRAIQNSK